MRKLIYVYIIVSFLLIFFVSIVFYNNILFTNLINAASINSQIISEPFKFNLFNYSTVGQLFINIPILLGLGVLVINSILVFYRKQTFLVILINLLLLTLFLLSHTFFDMQIAHLYNFNYQDVTVLKMRYFYTRYSYLGFILNYSFIFLFISYGILIKTYRMK